MEYPYDLIQWGIVVALEFLAAGACLGLWWVGRRVLGRARPRFRGGDGDR